jgi:ditrans,polycis-polyprenyl diphosphate synthase
MYLCPLTYLACVVVSFTRTCFISVVLSKAQRSILSIVSAGPLPQHVAFVMDGNRRYARSKHEVVHRGHVAGLASFHKACI